MKDILLRYGGFGVGFVVLSICAILFVFFFSRMSMLSLDIPSQQDILFSEYTLTTVVDTTTSTAEVSAVQTTSTLTMLHLGDMMLDRYVAVLIDRYGFDWLFAPLVSTTPSIFSDPDLTVVNLEGPFAERRIETSKEIAFRFDPTLASRLAEMGIDLAILANNHTQDMGRSAVEETRTHLTNVGIRYVGEQYAVSSSSLHIETIASTSIAFVAINDTHPNTNIDRAIALISHAEDIADLTIVSIHWGAEYQPLSHTRQRTLAHQFIDAGADAIIGHHPHVVQEIEIYNGVPILYSLGNFVFDQYFSVETQQGIGVQFEIQGDTIHSMSIIPFKSNRSQIHSMNEIEQENFLDALFDRSRLDGYTQDNALILL